eukprot:scaffold297_cov171-Amphora_coffeaeformis.AAC.1
MSTVVGWMMCPLSNSSFLIAKVHGKGFGRRHGAVAARLADWLACGLLDVADRLEVAVAVAAALCRSGRDVRWYGKLHKGFDIFIHVVFHETATSTTAAVTVGVTVAKVGIILASLLLPLGLLGPSLPSGAVGWLFTVAVGFFGVGYHGVSDKCSTWHGDIGGVGRLRGHRYFCCQDVVDVCCCGCNRKGNSCVCWLLRWQLPPSLACRTGKISDRNGRTGKAVSRRHDRKRLNNGLTVKRGCDACLDGPLRIAK